MQVVITTDELAFDVQTDTDLENGNLIFSEGPDRAYLYLCAAAAAAGGDPAKTLGGVLLALWRVDSIEASQVLAAGLGAPLPSLAEPLPFEVNWIRGGVLALKRKRIGADAAMWLLHCLAAENVLQYTAHLFGGHAADGEGVARRTLELDESGLGRDSVQSD